MKVPILKRPVLLAAILALVTLPSQQLALCVDENGHRQLELLSAECCPIEAAHETHDGLEAKADGCAPDCIDTPVGAADATGISSPSSNPLPDFHAVPDLFTSLQAGGFDLLISNAVRGRDGPGLIPAASSAIVRTTVRRL